MYHTFYYIINKILIFLIINMKYFWHFNNEYLIINNTIR